MWPFSAGSRVNGHAGFDLEKSENACAGFFTYPSEEKVCMGFETRE
jgi:hypothetical protein